MPEPEIFGNYEKGRRAAKLAASYFDRACTILEGLAKADEPYAGFRWGVGYEAQQMLWKIMFEASAGAIVDILPEDELEDIERFAKDLHRRVRARRLKLAMADTSGRTEGEKQAIRTARARLS